MKKTTLWTIMPRCAVWGNFIFCGFLKRSQVIAQLNIEFPEEILGELDINKDSELLTAEQIDKIKIIELTFFINHLV